MVNWTRLIVGTLLALVGGFVVFHGVKPQNNVFIVSGLLTVVIAGLVIDLDDVGKALLKLGETKISLPKVD